MSTAAAHAGSMPVGRPVDALIRPESATKAPESPRQIAVARLKENRIAQVAAVVFTCLVLACMAAPWIEQHWAGRTAIDQNISGSITKGGKKVDVVSMRGVPEVGPGLRTEYTLGSDPLGRDVFMRILQGGRVSLLVGFSAAIITTVLAVLLGLLAGYRRGWWDTAISRYFDVQMSFPTIYLAVAIGTALATSKGSLAFLRESVLLPIMIIGIVGIPSLGRQVRAQVLSLAEREFVEAARAQGASDTRIMLRHIFPGVTNMVITYFGLMVSAYILFEAALSFIGVGVQPPTPSWGNLIADGRPFYSTAWWICFFPGAAIMVTVLSLNLMGEALEEALDPKAIGGK